MTETTTGASTHSTVDNTEDYTTGNCEETKVATSSFNVKMPISSFTIKTTPTSSIPVETSI